MSTQRKMRSDRCTRIAANAVPGTSAAASVPNVANANIGRPGNSSSRTTTAIWKSTNTPSTHKAVKNASLRRPSPLPGHMIAF